MQFANPDNDAPRDSPGEKTRPPAHTPRPAPGWRRLLARLFGKRRRTTPGTTVASNIALPATTRTRLALGGLFAERYRIDAFLERGGMGEVYRALDAMLDVPVALKIIRPEIAADPDALRRFKQEVLLARSVSHPNVCRIYDLGRDAQSGISYLTMELLPGRTLRSRVLADGPLAPAVALPIVRQMADGLAAAHRAGVIHRDLKTDNVMLVTETDDERAVIMDFGLAVAPAREDDGGKARGPHVITGTPAYMSPEQVNGAPLSAASDLYAFGVVLFEVSTGVLPFQYETGADLLRAHLGEPPPSPREFADLPTTWERTILKLLAKEPEARCATATDVILELEGRMASEHAIARHRLPAEHDTFIGRRLELDAIAAALEAPDATNGAPEPPRLLTLLGPGGTGKTRLAQRYAWESLARWPGGAWFCDLSEVRTVNGIANTVATALDVPLAGGDPVAQLGHAIASRGRSLIVLDNFEQVVEHGDATIGRWIERAAEARFLITSRERLDLRQETTQRLEPLDPVTHGVDLFEVRAREHRPGFAVDDANRREVEAIVERLEGLPLAIELAASRLRMLTLDQLRERLADRLRILSGGKKGRHSALRATLDWSWELLHPWEQSALAQASIFEGGFTLEAAEEIIDLHAHDAAPLVLDVLQALIDKSLLRARVALGAPRFEMFATVQDYASSRLAEVDGNGANGGALLDAVGSRHAGCYARLGADDALEALHGRGGRARRAALQLERDNLVAACRWAIARGDGESAAAAYLAAAQVLALRGPYALSIELGLEVLAAPLTPHRRAGVLRAVAEPERYAGDMDVASQHYEAALAIYREANDRRNIGIVLHELGVLCNDQGRMLVAHEHYETALRIHRQLGNRRLEGRVHSSLATLHHEQGRMQEARQHYEAALALHRETGDRHAEGVVLGNLGVLHREQGRVDAAHTHCEAALTIHREVGNRRSEGNTLGYLASVHLDLGHVDACREHFEAAVAIHRDIGNRRSEGIALGNLGSLHMQTGHLDAARRHYEAALSIHREIGERRYAGIVLGNLGALDREQHRADDARQRLEEALTIHRELKNRRMEGVVLDSLGGLDLDAGRIDIARQHYEAALAIHREVGDQRFEAVALANLGAVHGRQRRMDDAHRSFEAALEILRHLGPSVDLGKALCQQAELAVLDGNAAGARTALGEADAMARELDVTPESELAQRIGKVRSMLDAGPD